MTAWGLCRKPGAKKVIKQQSNGSKPWFYVPVPKSVVTQKGLYLPISDAIGTIWMHLISNPILPKRVLIYGFGSLFVGQGTYFQCFGSNRVKNASDE